MGKLRRIAIMEEKASNRARNHSLMHRTTVNKFTNGGALSNYKPIGSKRLNSLNQRSRSNLANHAATTVSTVKQLQ